MTQASQPARDAIFSCPYFHGPNMVVCMKCGWTPHTLPTPAAEASGKDELTKDDPVGWYEAELDGHANYTQVLWWDGSVNLWPTKPVEGSKYHPTSPCDFNRWSNFRPLIPASSVAALQAEVAQLKADYEKQRQFICEERDSATATIASRDAEIAALKSELAMWKPMTPEEAEAAYEAAEAMPISEEEINAIVAKVTDPTYRPTEPEHVLMVAEIRRLRTRVNELEADRTDHDRPLKRVDD